MPDITTVKLTIPQLVGIIVMCGSLAGTLAVMTYRLESIEKIIKDLPPVWLIEKVEDHEKRIDKLETP